MAERGCRQGVGALVVRTDETQGIHSRMRRETSAPACSCVEAVAAHARPRCARAAPPRQYNRNIAAFVTAPRPEGAALSNTSACAANTKPARAGFAGMA